MVSDVEVTWRFESNSVGMGAGAAPERNPPRARACASCGAGGALNLPLISIELLPPPPQRLYTVFRSQNGL